VFLTDLLDYFFVLPELSQSVIAFLAEPLASIDYLSALLSYRLRSRWSHPACSARAAPASDTPHLFRSCLGDLLYWASQAHPIWVAAMEDSATERLPLSFGFSSVWCPPVSTVRSPTISTTIQSKSPSSITLPAQSGRPLSVLLFLTLWFLAPCLLLLQLRLKRVPQFLTGVSPALLFCSAFLLPPVYSSQ